MRREFFINIVFLITVNLLIKPFYIFGIDRTVQNVVGSETYGSYAFLLSYAYLFQIINDFGIQYYNNRNIAQYRHLLPKYLPNILVLKFILGSLYLLLGFAFAYFAWGDSFRVDWLLLLLFNQFMVSMIFYLRSNISGLGFYRIDSLFSILDKLLMIGICSVLLWGMNQQNFQIDWFIYAQTLSFGITALLTLVFVLAKAGRIRLKFNKAFIFLILKRSFPYAIAVFLMGLYTRIDQVMIGRMLTDGDYQNGVYYGAYRFLDAANMIGFLFAGLLLPMFARMLKDKEDFSQLLVFSFKTLFTGTVVVSVFSFFYQMEIMDLLYEEATPYWGTVLGWLMFSFIAGGTVYIFGTLLSANGSLKGLNYIALVGAIANIGLNLLLIPMYKAEGAALATLITQSMVALSQVILCKYIFDFKINVVLLLRMLVYVVFVVCVFYLTMNYLNVFWIWKLITGVLLSFSFAMLIRMLDVGAVKGFLAQKVR